jgi:hypothetical protein
MVVVQKRADLSAFVDDLPKHARGLRQSCGENITESNLACRENELFISASADIDQVIRQLAKRRSEAEQVMKQAEAIGLQIKRRPYAEYIEYIRETGISRVEVHGFGVFEHGKLFFHPERRELAVRSTESENAFIVGPADGRPKLSIN